MSIEDGGPAFPGYTMHDDGTTVQITKLNPGMTIRDYFAAAAMQGWIASFEGEIDHPGLRPETAASVAKLSYIIADAMLEAREAK